MSYIRDQVVLERPLGDFETFFRLPAENSVDMFLHLHFHAPPDLFLHNRLNLVWAIMRVRHPLLASSIHVLNYDDIRFFYNVPQSVEAVLQHANETLEFCSQTKDELIDRYMEGPRILSDDCLSYLILSTTSVQSEDDIMQYDLLICAAHSIGDGVAMHTFANDILTLVGGKLSGSELHKILENEWDVRCERGAQGGIPPSLETRLSDSTSSRLRRAVEAVDYRVDQGKLIGGHAFPLRKGPGHTVAPLVSYEREKTRQILRKCKSHGVTVSAALFALCNIAWVETNQENPELPMLMDTALNIRPLLNDCSISDSYWFLALGNCSVVLPSWLPRSSEGLHKAFWHRSKQAKEQVNRAIKSRMLASRTCGLTRELGNYARIRAKKGSESAVGLQLPPENAHTSESTGCSAPISRLLIVSSCGNLDNMYRHSDYPDINIHSSTTGTRRKAGAMVVVLYTFAGRLQLGIRYDEDAFDKSVVNEFWEALKRGVDAFLA